MLLIIDQIEHVCDNKFISARFVCFVIYHITLLNWKKEDEKYTRHICILRIAKNSIAVSSIRLFEFREQKRHNKAFCIPVKLGISNFSILVHIIDVYSGWLSFFPRQFPLPQKVVGFSRRSS